MKFVYTIHCLCIIVVVVVVVLGLKTAYGGMWIGCVCSENFQRIFNICGFALLPRVQCEKATWEEEGEEEEEEEEEEEGEEWFKARDFFKDWQWFDQGLTCSHLP